MNVTTVLALDSSTLFASVALVTGDAAAPRILAQAQTDVATHSERLLVLVDEVLGEAGLGLDDVDGIAVGAGPGSFTGLRIGMATAKGLAFAAGKPLWATSSLAALALEASAHVADLGHDREEGSGEEGSGDDAERPDVPDGAPLVLAVMDARRGEVFVGFYRVAPGTVVPVVAERVMAPEALRDAALDMKSAGASRLLAAGDGLTVHAGPLGVEGDRLLDGLVEIIPGVPPTPKARAVARLALGSDRHDVLTSGAPAYIRLSEVEIKFPHGNPGGSFAPRE